MKEYMISSTQTGREALSKHFSHCLCVGDVAT